MKLLRDRWLPMFALAKDMERRAASKNLMTGSRVEQGMNADYRASEALMLMSETIVLPSETMMELIHTLPRIDTRGWIRLPYPYILIQFTNPIPEKDIMAHVELNNLQKDFGILDDYVEGILICNAEQAGAPFPPQHVFNMMNASVLFKSTSVNRVAWIGTDKPSIPKWNKSFFLEHELPTNQRDNKQRIIALCYAINLFLNAPNVIVQKQKPDPKVQAKREKKGKQQLPEYHTVTIKKVEVKYEEPSGGKGSPHSRMYPVRAHFRRIKGYDEPIWIPNHYRGIKHGAESMLKEVYKVRPQK